MKKYVLAISLMVVPLAGVFAAPLLVREWPEVTLRGYGKLSAQSMTGAGFSRLRIRCESVEKAEILHAKFISDCRALGGVEDTSLPAGGSAVPVLVVPEQGLVSAFRNGNIVTVVSGVGERQWRQGLSDSEHALARAELAPNSQVPMFLDAWDQHGFRFYYRPWETPGPDVQWKESSTSATSTGPPTSAHTLKRSGR